jgi:hypothetical protein
MEEREPFKQIYWRLRRILGGEKKIGGEKEL